MSEDIVIEKVNKPNKNFQKKKTVNVKASKNNINTDNNSMKENNNNDKKKSSLKIPRAKDLMSVKEMERLNEIDKKLDTLDFINNDTTELTKIIKGLDQEINELIIKFNDEKGDNEKNNLSKEQSLYYDKLINVNEKLIAKTLFENPFETFIYTEDDAKEEILKDFFRKINSDVHWLELKSVDFNSTHNEAIEEKNEILTSSLIDVLEEKLELKFSNIQKKTLKEDFKKVAFSINDEFDDIISECNKIKTVSNTKIISRPSYKNFISNSELRKNDVSKKLSTLRFNFLSYITKNEKSKREEISDSLVLHMKSIKEILEVEKEEFNKKMKIFFLLITMSILLTTVAATAGALSIITIGSAAALLQSKVMLINSRIRKLDMEISKVENNESELIDETYDKLEKTVSELLEDETYIEVTNLYKKKKKSELSDKKLKEKIEEQIRISILNNVSKLNEDKIRGIIRRANKDVDIKISRGKINDKNKIKDNQSTKQIDEKQINVDANVQIEL